MGITLRSIAAASIAIAIKDLAETKGISLRQAALVAGINEVAGALKVRGIYP